jgi:RHS repeat-associated protein
LGAKPAAIFVQFLTESLLLGMLGGFVGVAAGYAMLRGLVAMMPAPWTQQYTYDDFGNLTAKILNGTTASIPVNAATNQLSSATYDLNGNMTSGLGATFTYDESNRMSSATEISGGMESYFYAPDNKRVYAVNSSGGAEFTLYGVRGEQLGVFGISGYQTVGAGQYKLNFYGIQSKIWFAGKLIWDYNQGAAPAPGPVYQDRLQTNRVNGARFYPYGDEITSTSNDREKFATYTRDSYTGLDYADQRYYASTYGRFNTPDPYMAAAKGANDPTTPGSWNRYAYVQGDPINGHDSRGLYIDEEEDDVGGGSAIDISIGGGYVGGASYTLTGWQQASQAACNQEVMALMASNPTESLDCNNGMIVTVAAPATPPPPQCPLVAPTGDYTVAPGVVALFAPNMAADIDAAFAVLNQEGIDPTITSGFRTAAGQLAQQNSPYGAAQVSWHQVGEAIDINSKVPSVTFQAIVAAMTAEGLTWGGTFSLKDPVHFQNAPAGTSPSAAQVAACASQHP